MNDAYKAPVALVGRILLALMFVLSGYGKLTNLAGTAGYIASGGLPAPMVLAAAAGLFELLAGLAVVAGFKTRWVGLVLAAFTVLVSVLFHPFWSVPAEQQMVTQLLFMKNLSVAGGFLLLSALGAGPLSLDGRANRA